MNVTLTDGWTEVSVARFEQFLSMTDDYVRDSYVGVARYRWRHNDRVFAEAQIGPDQVERVWVNPRLVGVKIEL